MGNTSSFGQPKNQTGKKVVIQKLENASKTGILSLQEHDLEEVPHQVFSLSKLRSLDLSKNSLKDLSTCNLGGLINLKVLNFESNKLRPGSLKAISELHKLQVLNAGGWMDGLRQHMKSLREYATPNLCICPPRVKISQARTVWA